MFRSLIGLSLIEYKSRSSLHRPCNSVFLSGLIWCDAAPYILKRLRLFKENEDITRWRKLWQMTSSLRYIRISVTFIPDEDTRLECRNVGSWMQWINYFPMRMFRVVKQILNTYSRTTNNFSFCVFRFYAVSVAQTKPHKNIHRVGSFITVPPTIYKQHLALQRAFCLKRRILLISFEAVKDPVLL